MFVDFTELAPWQNGLVFAVAAAAVWGAGTRLPRVVAAIADRTGLGEAFLGLVLLAGATELPEFATTVFAAAGGNPQLAVHNMFGGITMQTAVLAVADAVFARGALTYFVPQSVLLLQGNLLLLLLGSIALAIAAGEPIALGWVGLSPPLLLVAYVGALWLLRVHEGDGGWRPVDPPPPVRRRSASERPENDWPKRRLVLGFALTSLVVLLAGAALSWSADALATQTGLGASFVGAALLAASTSLPELSTTIAAVRMGSPAMAVSNIFGSNMIMVALLLPADLASTDGPILRSAGDSAPMLVGAGMVVTSLYLVGMLERRDRTVLRLGYDSVGVVIVYALSLVLLYWRR